MSCAHPHLVNGEGREVVANLQAVTLRSASRLAHASAGELVTIVAQWHKHKSAFKQIATKTHTTPMPNQASCLLIFAPHRLLMTKHYTCVMALRKQTTVCVQNALCAPAPRTS